MAAILGPHVPSPMVVNGSEVGQRVELRPYAECDLEREVIWLHLTEDQASAMAGGYVPNSVKGVLRELLDYELEDLKRAEGPVRKKKSAGGAPPASERPAR